MNSLKVKQCELCKMPKEKCTCSAEIDHILNGLKDFHRDAPVKSVKIPAKRNNL